MSDVTPKPPRKFTTAAIYWRLPGKQVWELIDRIPNDPHVLAGIRRVLREAGYEAATEGELYGGSHR